jgi:hypothetical protein
MSPLVLQSSSEHYEAIRGYGFKGDTIFLGTLTMAGYEARIRNY